MQKHQDFCFVMRKEIRPRINFSFRKYLLQVFGFVGLSMMIPPYVVMDCWNGGDGRDEPDLHDIFEGIVVWNKNCAGFGTQKIVCNKFKFAVFPSILNRLFDCSSILLFLIEE